MEYTQFEATPMLAECFGPGQQVTFSGGRLDAERSQNMHGIFALDLSASNPSGMTALRNALMSQFGMF